MRIALLTDGIYPFVIGGMQKHSYYLAKYFARQGVEVDLYHFSDQAADLSEIFSAEELKNIHSIQLKFPKYFSFPGHYLIESYHYSISIFKELQKRPAVDFIYSKGFTAWKLLEEKKKGQSFPPIGVNFHGYEMFQPFVANSRMKREKWMLRPAVRFSMKQADYVFSYGGKIDQVIQDAGISPEKILTSISGVEADALQEESKLQVNTPLRFLFLGRYERRKGVEELNEAIKALLPDQDFEFHFAGPIPNELKVRHEKVKYHGSLTGREVINEVIDQCDVLVCPSYSEGFPNVIIEAMSRGLTAIATNVGAVACAVNVDNGWLMDNNTSSTIEHHLKEALSRNKEQLLQKRKAALQYMKEHLLWEKVIGDLMQKIKQVLEEATIN